MSNEQVAKGLVSAIIPVYNGARFLAEAIQSILAQSYQPIEIIVVDDGSTDGSGEIAAGFPKITIIRQENGGVAVARNTGIEQASGEFIAFLDADDEWTPEKTALQVRYLRDNPECDYILSHYENYFTMGVPAWFRRKEADSSVRISAPSTLLCRSDLFATLGRFDPSLRRGEDTDWFGRAQDSSAVGHMFPEVLMRRRVHDRNLSADIPAGQQDLLRLLRASVQRKRARETGEDAK